MTTAGPTDLIDDHVTSHLANRHAKGKNIILDTYLVYTILQLLELHS